MTGLKSPEPETVQVERDGQQLVAINLFAEVQLRVLALNCFLIPFASDDRPERAALFPSLLLGQGFDVIIFSELFDNSARETVLDGIQNEFLHQSDVVGGDTIDLEDGGVVIVCRSGLEFQDRGEHVFSNASAGWDSVAGKGVRYVTVVKDGHTFHIFGTHTQASDEREVRDLQFQQLRDFEIEQHIPGTDAVIFGGDLNVNFHDNRGFRSGMNEYRSMLDRLEAAAIRNPLATEHTYDPLANELAKGTSRELLDYVLTGSDHLPHGPESSFEIRHFATPAPWHENGITRYITDHFGIDAKLVFRV